MGFTEKFSSKVNGLLQSDLNNKSLFHVPKDCDFKAFLQRLQAEKLDLNILYAKFIVEKGWVVDPTFFKLDAGTFVPFEFDLAKSASFSSRHYSTEKKNIVLIEIQASDIDMSDEVHNMISGFQGFFSDLIRFDGNIAVVVTTYYGNVLSDDTFNFSYHYFFPHHHR